MNTFNVSSRKILSCLQSKVTSSHATKNFSQVSNRCHHLLPSNLIPLNSPMLLIGFYFEIIPTHELTLPDIQPSSSNLTSSVHSKPISSTLETRHSSTPPLTYLLVTIDGVIYTVPSKKNSRRSCFIDSGNTLHPLNTPFQIITMTDAILRIHLNCKAKLPSSYMTATTSKFRLLKDRNIDHYVRYASKNSEPLSFGHTKGIRFSCFNSVLF